MSTRGRNVCVRRGARLEGRRPAKSLRVGRSLANVSPPPLRAEGSPRDAAAQIAQQTGAAVAVVSVDGLELEALSTVPRSELQALAQQAVDSMVAHLREAGVEATGDVRAGHVTRGILLFAEEHEADVIVCGASTRGPVATRILGSVPLDLVERSRRPVLVITPPHGEEASHGRQQ
jgi:nucleotide-binding universal stress UspA family protein